MDKQQKQIPFVYIDDKDSLRQACEEWKKCRELAIDIECENNLHHYGVYVSIIQVSSQNDNWIIDVLKLQDIQPLIETLENKDIQKIFHDIGFDFRVLYHQFRCRVKNYFDTQYAALLLGKENISLDSLLSEYFGISKQSHLQMADWTARPIKNHMLQYAIKDTVFLITLRDKLKEELRRKNRLSWAEEEFRANELRVFEMEKQTAESIKGYSSLSDRQKAVLRYLFFARERMAKRVDRPAYFVFSNKKLKELAQNPPSSIQFWENMKNVHPIIRRMPFVFHEAVMKGKNERIILQKLVRKRRYNFNNGFTNMIAQARTDIAAELGIKEHLIMSKDQLIAASGSGSLRELRHWQRELFERNLRKQKNI